MTTSRHRIPDDEPTGDPPNLADIGPWGEWARYILAEIRRQVVVQERQAVAQERLLERLIAQEDKAVRDKADTDHAASMARVDITSLQRNGARSVMLSDTRKAALVAGVVSGAVSVLVFLVTLLIKSSMPK